MYHYLFGPVPSRRLGISLGVDLVPLKTCTLNCIYCECGPTTHLTVSRKEYAPLEGVKSELDHYFEHHPTPDYVTFSGSGEPTLNVSIGAVIGHIKTLKPGLPTAVLTNGILLTDQQVRDDLQKATIVMPSLDAAVPQTFIKLCRPHKSIQVDQVVDGLVRFHQEYEGRLWLEIFIAPGLNDTEPELIALKKAIHRITPDEVQLNTLDRPGIDPQLRAATRKELEQIAAFWGFDHVSIIAHASDRKESASYRQDAASAILETIARRPCTLEDLKRILGLHINEINKYLDVLEAEGNIKVVEQPRGFFYGLSDKF